MTRGPALSILALFASALAAPASSQTLHPDPRLTGEKPDAMLRRHQDTPGALSPANLKKPRPAAPFDLTGTWFIDISGGFNPFTFGPPYPELIGKVRTRRQRDAAAGNSDSMGKCFPLGMPMAMTSMAPVAFIQLPTAIYMVSGSANSFRTIYIDGRDHGDAVPTYNGESIGRWEGDALVVNTRGFQTEHHWIDNIIAISDQFRIAERIRMLPGGHTFEIEFVMTDPKTWKGEWRVIKRWHRQDRSDVVEDECVEARDAALPGTVLGQEELDQRAEEQLASADRAARRSLAATTATHRAAKEARESQRPEASPVVLADSGAKARAIEPAAEATGDSLAKEPARETSETTTVLAKDRAFAAPESALDLAPDLASATQVASEGSASAGSRSEAKPLAIDVVSVAGDPLARESRAGVPKRDDMLGGDDVTGGLVQAPLTPRFSPRIEPNPPKPAERPARTARRRAAPVRPATVSVPAMPAPAEFDRRTTISLKGRVVDLIWADRRSRIALEVANTRGALEHWDIEIDTGTVLARRQWQRLTLVPGEQIIAAINPMSDGQRRGLLKAVIMPDGRVVDARRVNSAPINAAPLN